MSNINDVVDVEIAIESPATDSASFSNLLLIVPQPSSVGTEDMSEIAVIHEAKDLTVFGYGSEDEAYKAAVVAFGQDVRPDKVYVIARKKKTAEADETISECLYRAVAVNEWYGFSLVSYTSMLDLEGAAKWAEANNKLFGFTYLTGNCPIEISGYDNTFGFFAGDLNMDSIPDGNTYAAVALMIKCFSYDPGSETWSLKSLRGVKASNLSASKKEQLKDGNINFYRTIANKDVTQEGKVGSGEWIDVIRFREWLLNKIQIEVFNFMVRQPKVAFNDGGIVGIQNVLESVLSKAQETGGIDGDKYNEDEVLEKGYVVTVPRAANVSKADKQKRRFTGITFEARLAGAIHETKIRGTLVY